MLLFVLHCFGVVAPKHVHFVEVTLVVLALAQRLGAIL